MILTCVSSFLIAPNERNDQQAFVGADELVLTRNGLKQTSANQGPDSRFVVEVISKPLIPKLSRSWILKTQNCAYTNTLKFSASVC